jgi:hypothetical protein
MFFNQRRVQQLNLTAKILSCLGCSLVAVMFVTVSVASADPVALSNGILAEIRVDPNPVPQPGSGSSITVFPKPPLQVTSPLIFNFNPVGNLLAMQSGTPAQQALAAQVTAGFAVAGDRWRALFIDPIIVNLEIDYGPIGNGVLGGASSVSSVQSYTAVRTNLAVDLKSLDDVSAVASLQLGSMDFITNDTALNTSPATSVRIRDNNIVGVAANNNNFLDISRANAKALGLLGASPAADANIAFTDFADFTFGGFNWDFDPTNGIAAGSFDFTGVATHEIGHTMGFFSGVDIVDLVGSPNGPARLPASGGPYDLDQFAVYSALDLYRFSANSLAQGSQPVGGLRDLAFGQLGTGPYFSINSGVTNLARMSTGSFNGDGSQASHWKDSLGIGIMDPTVAPGELLAISTLDRRGMDVIGWDPVPEPAGLVLLTAAIVGLSCCRCGRIVRRVS